MLDLTGSLYLGLRHASAELGSFGFDDTFRATTASNAVIRYSEQTVTGAPWSGGLSRT